MELSVGRAEFLATTIDLGIERVDGLHKGVR